MSQEKMEKLKGSATALIKNAYLHRDKIGLITFRNHLSQVLLPLRPRSHFSMAIECIKNLPSGGGTPLASGLLEGVHLLLNEKRRGTGLVPIIVLMSDGKANVPTTNRLGIIDEITFILRKMRKEGILLVFIDTDIDGKANTTKDYSVIRQLLKRESWFYQRG
jgi:magnesium chelatase subunit D